MENGINTGERDLKAGTKKGLDPCLNLFLRTGSGGWIRTNDLRVMSPTSYQTAPPRIKYTLKAEFNT